MKLQMDFHQVMDEYYSDLEQADCSVWMTALARHSVNKETEYLH